MRQPRPADVMAAVQFVTGTDPNARGQRRQIASARRLAAQALAEICDLGQRDIAYLLGLERTTVRYHLHADCDFDALAMVCQRISDQIDAEETALEAARHGENMATFSHVLTAWKSPP